MQNIECEIHNDLQSLTLQKILPIVAPAGEGLAPPAKEKLPCLVGRAALRWLSPNNRKIH